MTLAHILIPGEKQAYCGKRPVGGETAAGWGSLPEGVPVCDGCEQARNKKLRRIARAFAALVGLIRATQPKEPNR